MAEFFTNLPPKDKDELQKTIEKLTTTNYQTDYEFNVGEYEATADTRPINICNTGASI